MINDSESEISTLRSQLFIQLIALIMIAGTLTVYLYRHYAIDRHQVAQAEQVINIYTLSESNMVNFVNELAVYGEKNPDFAQQVLKKYGIVPPTGAAAAASPRR